MFFEGAVEYADQAVVAGGCDPGATPGIFREAQFLSGPDDGA